MKATLVGLAVPFAAFEAIAIHSALAGQPAASAFAGLGVFGALMAGLAFGLLPEAGRHRPLSRAAVLASALAILCALALPGKIAAARGAAPPTTVLVSSVLLLLFQTGWALCYWLTADRGRRSPTRYVPAALGAVLLIGGGFVNGIGISSAPKPVEPAGEKLVSFPRPESFPFARETARGGAAEQRPDFAHVHTGQQPLLGLSMSTREWMRRHRIGSDLRGIFERSATPEGAHVLMAEPGFAVAAIEVQGEKHVDALRVEFGPLDGSRVSLVNRYWSDWVGDYHVSEETSHIDADSGLVVGLIGSKGLVLDSLGLLVAR